MTKYLVTFELCAVAGDDVEIIASDANEASREAEGIARSRFVNGRYTFEIDEVCITDVQDLTPADPLPAQAAQHEKKHVFVVYHHQFVLGVYTSWGAAQRRRTLEGGGSEDYRVEGIVLHEEES